MGNGEQISNDPLTGDLIENGAPKSLTNVSRRNRMKPTGAAIGFPMIVPSRVFGKFSPSNLIQVGQIGCGRSIARASEIAGVMHNTEVARYIAVLRSGQHSRERREITH
jgi:hypothetical protein